jgi:hypothetical protein
MPWKVEGGKLYLGSAGGPGYRLTADAAVSGSKLTLNKAALGIGENQEYSSLLDGDYIK